MIVMDKKTFTNQSTSYAQPRHELVHVAEAVAREKGLEKEEVMVALEFALQKAARAKYGMEHDIHVTIDRSSGEMQVFRRMQVVDDVDNPMIEISLKNAKIDDPAIELGGVLIQPLPPIDFGRMAAQNARQVIIEKVREAERAKQFAEFKDRVGEVISGTVKRVEFGNTIVDLGRAEGILKRNEMIAHENFRVGDRIRSYIHEVKQDARGPMVSLSRTHPKFMAKLFEQEVPEIYDGLIQIKSVARDPGSRAKISVYCSDPTIDPVGSCVGIRGSRVQAVTAELRGEKVDIVLWSANPATFVVNSLAPAEVMKVVLDEEKKRFEIIVAQDQQSLAIGRRGQNVRLASILTGWKIDIMTQEQEETRRTEQFSKHQGLFITALDIDEVIAQLLVGEGFETIEEVAYVTIDELMEIEGFDEDIAKELQKRAIDYLTRTKQNVIDNVKKLGAKADLIDFEALSLEMLETLVKNNIKTLDDLAELSGEELLDLLGKNLLNIDQANDIIMKARAHWFKEEETK